MSHLLYVSFMGEKKLHMNNITDETRLERFLQKKKQLPT